jgi:1,5-anhydro-D-fructose reductase (1,5-anhydro-D-mannitol-forming)
VLGVNHHLRASALHRRMRDMIAAGAIGEVRSISILHAGLLREVLRTWRLTDSGEGAIYLDLSVHDIDLARFLLQQEPVSVCGMGDALALGGAGIDDHAMYMIRMSGGAFLQVHESFVTPSVESQVLVLGSTGMLIAQGTLAQRAGGTLLHRHASGTDTIEVPPVDLYGETIRQFRDAITGHGQPLASGEDGYLSLAAAETVREAVTSGKTITFRP